MHCRLKDLVGFPAACEAETCVFWREPDPGHGTRTPGCVLEEFALTGTFADRLTLWLLAYKFAADRAATARQVNAQHERNLRRAPTLSGSPFIRSGRPQNSPSWPRRTSVA